MVAALPVGAADSKAARYYEDALKRYEQQDLPGTIIQLKNALQIDKSMLAVQLLLGKALLATGDVLAAEVALQEALRLGVNRAEVVVPLAQASLALGRHRAVLDQPQFALAGLPHDAQVQLLLLRASAASDIGETRNALQFIAEAASMAPRDANVWLAEVPIRIRVRQYRDAERAIAKAAALAPQSAELHYQRAALAHVEGRISAALVAYDQAIAADARHGEARIARAGVYLDLRRRADAARDLDELQKLLPGEPRAAYLRAVLAQNEGKTDERRAALKQVTDLLDPVPLDAVRYRPQMLLLNGMAHFELGEREKAKGYLDAFQRLQPNTPAVKLLAQIYLQDNDVERAIAVLESYLRAQPGDGQALSMLASSHMAQGRSARAITLLQEALRTADQPEHRTLLGMGLFSSGQGDAALAELESVWRKDPRQAKAGVALVGLYLRAGNPAEAVAVAQALTQRSPKHAGYQDLLGMALAQSGKMAPARQAFERAIAIEPSWLAPQLHLARLDIAERRFEAAESRLSSMVKQDEKNVDAWMELALLAARRGRVQDQLGALQKAYDQAGRDDLRPGLALVELHLRDGRAPQALELARTLGGKAGEKLDVALALAGAQLANGDAVGARTTLSTASRAAGYDPDANLRIATLQMQAEHLDGAAYSLEKALSSAPDNLAAAAMRVDLDLRRNELGPAEQRARQIAQQHPKRAIGQTLLGDVSRARGQAAAALEAYRRAHQVEPSTESALRIYRTLLAQGDARAAARAMEEWVRQRPQDLVARRTLADGYAATEQYAAARSAYDALLKLVPDDVAALNNQANVLLRLKDPGAVAMAERAFALAPTDANALDTLGWALFQSGNAKVRDRALQLLRDARLREPGNAEIRYHLAAVLAQSGGTAEVREEATAALKLGLASEFHADARRLADHGR